MPKPRDAEPGQHPGKTGSKGSAPHRDGAKSRPAFPIVGIGASAGGLAAFEAFFSAMPADFEPGMAFVLVQHLAPDHKSILTELIARYTRMAVFEVEDGMVVQPNCAYIIPPNRDMALINGALQLLEPAEPRGRRLPIDFFFRSLAEDQHERAICIVLSGTGSDGTLGLRAVKGEGGMAMAQNPESTEFDGMPSSAIATGLVDYVLPPEEMPARLMAYAAHAFAVHHARDAAGASLHSDSELQKVFALLRMRTGNDFSLYKQSTIKRRLARRMAVNQIERLEDYVSYLQHEPDEIEALFRDLLIGVTSFFRNPEVFAALRDTAIAQILDSKEHGDTVRAWVPACSTGEEAYSIAILIREQIEARKLNVDVKIFATDIDARAIAQARAGIYPASIAADVSSERLARYFTLSADDSVYRLHKGIRDMLIFSEQNVIKDPPFSRLDLVSCRNLLIYMRGSLQKKLIPLFHYALNRGGFLCLGTSESLGGHDALFDAVDTGAKIYRRKDDALLPQRPTRGAPVAPRTDGEVGVRVPMRSPGGAVSLRELMEQELIKRFEPVAALVNQRGEILYLHGRTGRYLEPSPGEPGVNILKMAREGLRLELATALRKAASQDEPVTGPGLRVKTNGNYTLTDLTVCKVQANIGAGDGSPLYLVVLEDARVAPEVSPAPEGAPVAAGTGANARVSQLEMELRAKEEYLQTALMEMETSNEELQSANEEMQSTNEELQSVNEELETSKEELQSVNEELATVNTELQQRVSELSRANNDMNNLLAGTGIGTVFVDNHLNIQRFTPAATRVINLIASDIGRPVGHIVSNLVGYDSLVSDVQHVLDTLDTRDVEVRTREGEWYLLRIRPYRTTENVIDGAAITLTEITDLKKAEQSALDSQAAARRLAVVVEDSHDAILVYDFDGGILAWNKSATRMYGWTESEALGMNISDLTPPEDGDRGLAVAKRLAQSETLEPFPSQRLTKNGTVKAVTLTATALIDGGGKPYAIATTERELPGR